MLALVLGACSCAAVRAVRVPGYPAKDSPGAAARGSLEVAAHSNLALPATGNLGVVVKGGLGAGASRRVWAADGLGDVPGKTLWGCEGCFAEVITDVGSLRRYGLPGSEKKRIRAQWQWSVVKKPEREEKRSEELLGSASCWAGPCLSYLVGVQATLMCDTSRATFAAVLQQR